MTPPLVTALIPAFNAAATIRRAVDLVLAQTYRNLELIVVDDGSRDATSEVVAANYGDQVRLLRLPRNQGESAATNEGIAAARGDLVAFLDADDEWLPGKLARQVDVLNASPDTVLVSCGCRFIDAQGQLIREFGMPPPEFDRNQAWRLLLERTFIAKPCVVARRSALLAAGPFDTSLAIAEDQDMWIRLALIGPVDIVPEFLTTVHDTAGSLTKVYATRVDRYVLPMIRGHMQRQMHRLTADDVNRILGERYAAVGRNLYQAGSLKRGASLIMRAVAMRHNVQENLWYLAAASPPARTVKRLVGYSGSDRTPEDRRLVGPPDGSLLQPQKQDLVALRLDRPILLVMVDAEAEFDWNGPFLRTLVSVRNLSQQVLLQGIFDRLGVRITFLVDYAVATQAEGFEPIRELLQSGRCEIGAHLQPWENPPFIEELSARTSFNANLPGWLQKEKLLRLTDAIVESFGVKPIAYRAGRYGVGEEIAWILRSLGYKIDVSVTAGLRPSAHARPGFSPRIHSALLVRPWTGSVGNSTDHGILRPAHVQQRSGNPQCVVLFDDIAARRGAMAPAWRVRPPGFAGAHRSDAGRRIHPGTEASDAVVAAPRPAGLHLQLSQLGIAARQYPLCPHQLGLGPTDPHCRRVPALLH